MPSIPYRLGHYFNDAWLQTRSLPQNEARHTGTEISTVETLRAMQRTWPAPIQVQLPPRGVIEPAVISSSPGTCTFEPPEMPEEGERSSQNLFLENLYRWVDEDEISGADRADRRRLARDLLSDLTVNAGLNLSGCTGLTSLPGNLTVNGSLTLNDCTGLISLPSGLTVHRDLNLGYCTGLTSLPANLMVNGDVYLAGCTGLTSLPPNLTVNGNLDLRGCTALTVLPTNLTVNGNLDLRFCTGLTTLPANLTVNGDLSLAYCAGLTSLPSSLTVNLNLELRFCTRLTALPSNLMVYGNLDLSGCTRLTSLPNSLLSWVPDTNGGPRRINLTGTGLSGQIQEHLRTQPNANLQIYYSETHNERRLGQVGTLHDSLEHFTGLRQTQELLTWPPNQQAVLAHYLARLISTADYGNATVRPVLTKRLDAALTLAHADTDFRAFALAVLDDAMATCGDRVILGLNTLEQELALKEARHQQGPQRTHALRRLGLSLMKLNIVHAHAAQSCRQMQFVDEVEVYLAYEVKLAERLGLPGKTMSTLYGSGVGPEAFEAAAQDAERQSADPIAVQAFLATWTPWQQHLRQTQADGTFYKDIVVQTGLSVALAYEPRVCAITQDVEEALTQPIYLGSKHNARVYDFAGLIKWWVEHGKEPAPFGAFTLDQLWRAGT